MFKSLSLYFSRFMMIAITFLVIAMVQAPPAFAGECQACHVSDSSSAFRTMQPQHEGIAALRFDSSSGIAIKTNTPEKAMKSQPFVSVSVEPTTVDSGNHASIGGGSSGITALTLAKLHRIPDH